MSALAQCDAFAYIYDQAGDPAPDILVVLKRVLDASGNPILLGPKTTLTDSAGSFHFTLPEFATAFISARASALWNCPEGRAFTVPPGPSGELVPDFSLPASTLVEPPLVYVGDVLSIPKASETQDGYLSAADYVRFEAGAAEMGITQIDTGAGLTGGPITDTGTIGLAPVSGVAGTWANPSSITVNAYGQIIAIAGVADTTAPVISAISATAITGSGATILWTTDDFSDSQVEYGPTISYGSTTTLATTPVTSHSVPITGTASSTLYHYRVKSRNTSGLLTTSGDNTFTTTATVDTTAPVISAVTATSITSSGATITWTTDEASDSQVDYGVTTSYGTSTTLDAAMVTSHSVPVTGLSVSTPYHYRVKSRNAVSLLQTSGDNSFTTLAAPLDVTVGLVSYWPMDETSGVRSDIIANNDLSIYPGGNDASAPGIIGNAVNGDGNPADFYLLTDDPSLHFSGSFTIAGWFYPISASTSGIFGMAGKWGPPGGRQWYLIYTATPLFEFAVSRDGTDHTGVDISAGLTLSAWHFIAAWFDFANQSIHLQIDNGTIANASVAGTGPVFPGTGGGTVLCYTDGTTLYRTVGKIDELGIWGRLLTPAELDHLWNSGAGRTYPF